MPDIETLQSALQNQNPRKTIKAALEAFDNIAIAFSGAEDVAVIDMAYNVRKDIQVFCLDTGRLHAETYRFLETVRKHYGIALEVLSPDWQSLENMVRAKGLFSFYEDGHQECCGIRKVEPLRRKLAGLDAWVTGQRKDQSLDTRQNLPEVEIDPVFSLPGKPLYKFNPLANWSSMQVWDYLEAYQVPYNELHAKGYTSIGCEPCTRPVLPNQHERSGRWWWEEGGKKECGLHVGNVRRD